MDAETKRLIKAHWGVLVERALEAGYWPPNDDPVLLRERVIELLEDWTEEGEQFRARAPDCANFIIDMAGVMGTTITSLIDEAL